MPLCGFNTTMVEGIDRFSHGLLTATLERGRQNNLDDASAIVTEVREIGLFINALKDKYGAAENSGKAMAEMIYGIAVFAGGLLKATLAQQMDHGGSFEPTFDAEVRKISLFLEQLESHHQILKKSNSPEDTMKKAVDWIDENDHVV